MGLSNSSFDAKVSDQFPEFKSYKECQSKAFTYSLGTFITTTASVVIGQEVGRLVIRQRLTPTLAKLYLVAPLSVGIVSSYFYSRKHTKRCQDMWMAAENKYTALSDDTGNKSE